MTDPNPIEVMRAPIVVLGMAALNAASSTHLVVPGPEWLVVLGVQVPLFSAGAGALGVLLGQLLAPPPAAPLGTRRKVALVITLHALVLASVILTGQQVLVVLSWGIGLGFAGLTVAETLGAQAIAGLKAVTNAFIAMLAAKAGGKEPPSDPS